MKIGFIISLIVVAILIIFILALVIPMDRKYIVRDKNRKIDFEKTTIYFRWNVFDSISLGIAVYTIICVQLLNILIMNGETIENPYVQFLTNQAQAWVIVGFIYIITRLSLVLKGIKVRWGSLDE